MIVLIADQKTQVSDMLLYSLESRYGTGNHFAAAKDVSEAVEVLCQCVAKGKVEMVIAQAQFVNKGFTEYLSQSLPGVPLVIFGSTDTLKNEIQFYQKIGARLITEKQILDDLYNEVDRLIQGGPQEVQNTLPTAEEVLADASPVKKKKPNSDRDVCRVKTELLLKVSPLACDVFVRLSSAHFVKVFHEGADFDVHDLDRWQKHKKVEFLYLRQEESHCFLQPFNTEIQKLLASDDLDPKEVQQTSKSIYDTVRDLSDSIGFTPEVQAIVKTNMDLTVKALGKNPRLRDILQRFNPDNKDYISSHSNVLSAIACSLAAGMEWSSEQTYQKLIMASFFHDFYLKNHDLARIRNLEELEQKKELFSEEEIEAFKVHPIKGSEFVKQFHEIPPDVDAIVAQHHEEPDGSGFPRKLNASRIAPLAAIFSVAHELIYHIYYAPRPLDPSEAVETLSKKYNRGHYKKVIAAIDVTKLL